MIHEYLMELKKADDRIRQLNELIDASQGIKAGMPSSVPSAGIGRPTENAAIRLAELKDELSEILQSKKQLWEKLKEGKKECSDELLWVLIWDHFYLGYTWKKTAARHNMKESAVKMRFSRFLKNVKEFNSGKDAA